MTEQKLTFSDWLLSVKSYLKYYAHSYRNDADKIIFVGTVMDKDALAWHNHRVRSLDRLKLQDTWTAYEEAMEAHFQDKFEKSDTYDEMFNLKYDGKIESYLVKMETMNLRVNVSGMVYIKAIRAGLPYVLKERMSYGEVPDDSTEYIEKLRSVARTYEAWLREEGKTFKGEQDKRNEKRKSKDGRKVNDSADPLKPQTSGNKVEKKKWGKDKKKSGEGSTQGQKKLHESREEALKGIAPSLIEKRTKENVCLRCGKKGHRWFFCRGEIVTASARKFAGQKRSRTSEAAQEAEEDGDPQVVKKAKVAARAQGDGGASDSWRGRIYEIDSEEEVD